MKLINLVVLVLVFVIIYNLFFFRVDLGAGNGLLFLLLNSFFFITRNKNTRNLDYALFSSTVAVIFASLFFLVGNGVVQLTDYLLAMAFSGVALFFYKYEPRFCLTLPDFLLLPLSSFLQTLSNLGGIVEEKEKNSETKENEITAAVVRGGIISLVVVGILFVLLIKGDLVFGQIVNNFFSNIIERLIMSVIVFVSLLNFGLSKMKDHLSWFGEATNLGKGKLHELSIILGSIIVLFTIFIVVQFRYLFMLVGEMDLRQIGISSATYSEYVRAGFSELLVAAAIAGGVLIYVSRFAHKFVEMEKGTLQILSTILTLETAFILASAVKRLFLYMDAHGLTRAREFGFVFLIWLAVILIILLASIIYKISRDLQAKMVITLSLVILLGINIINLDALIADKYPPTVNKEIDYSYITNLSTDASKSWIPAVNDAEKILLEIDSKPKIETEDYRRFYYAKFSLYNLNGKVAYLEDKYGPKDLSKISDKNTLAYFSKIRTWQAMNLSEYFAYQSIRDNKSTFDKLPTLLNTAAQIDSKVSEEVKNNTRFDRSANTPLTN